MEFAGGSDGGGEAREQDLRNTGSSSLLQLGGWGNCSISPQIYDEKDVERRERLVDFDAGRSNQEGERSAEREHMFDKVVTPSDVGKLNRLVIPKQHAEKYFPLDSTNNDKGLLLNFEDRSGKSWRFRYSYWNSSQSYVMTKGWSRFVKDKKLDAGDIVSFHRSDDRLFIDWRRRPFHPSPSSSAAAAASHHFSWSPLLMRPPHPTVQDHHHHHLRTNYHPYRYGYGSVIGVPKYPYTDAITTNRSYHEEESVIGANLQSAAPAREAASGGKKLRLFGVNMECSSGSEANSQQHHLQLRLYNGTPDHRPNRTANIVNDDYDKGKAISIPNSIPNSNSNSNSLDLDLDLDLDM